jgi:hypothetical protein
MLRVCVEDLLPMRLSPEQGVSFGPSQQPKGASNHGCKSAEAVKSRTLKESPPFSWPCVLRYPFLALPFPGRGRAPARKQHISPRMPTPEEGHVLRN